MFFFTFLLAFISGSLLFLVPNTSAETTNIGIKTTVAPSLSITTDAPLNTEGNPELTIPITPTPSGTLGTANLNITVFTSNPTGYALSMNSTTPTTSLVNTDTPTLTIPSTIHPYTTPSTLATDTWGYNTWTQTQVTNNTPPTTFALIPPPLSPQTITETTVASSTSITRLTFATNVTTNIMAGDYTNTLIFTATANYVPTTPTITSISPTTGWAGDTITITGTDFINITDITVGGASCTAITNPSDTTATCTLPTNTAGVQSVIVTTALGTSNTDITIEYILSMASTFQSFTQEMCNSMPNYNPASPDPASTIILTDTRDADPNTAGVQTQQYRVRKMQDSRCWMIDNLRYAYGTLNLTASNTAAGYYDPISTAYCADPANTLTGSLTKCGYLYNWYGATGGTGTVSMASNAVATGSICPNNENSANTTVGVNTPWKLPTGNTATTNTSTLGDLGVLDQAFGGTGATANPAASITNWVFSGSWSGIFSGHWVSSPSDQGGSGHYWSSMAYSSTTMARNLSFNASDVFNANIVIPGTNGINKAYGLAVRCVL